MEFEEDYMRALAWGGEGHFFHLNLDNKKMGHGIISADCVYMECNDHHRSQVHEALLKGQAEFRRSPHATNERKPITV